MAESRSAAASAGQPSAASAGGEEPLADGVREIATAWARYAEAVMRQTSEASQALLRCHSFSEMLEVQARLLQGNMQAFLDQSTRVADIATRVSSRSFDALRKTGTDPGRS